MLQRSAARVLSNMGCLRNAHRRLRREACEAVFVVAFGQRAAALPCPWPCARLRPPLLAPKPRRPEPLVTPAPPHHHTNDDAGYCDQRRQCLAVRGRGVNEWRAPASPPKTLRGLTLLPDVRGRGITLDDLSSAREHPPPPRFACETPAPLPPVRRRGFCSSAPPFAPPRAMRHSNPPATCAAAPGRTRGWACYALHCSFRCRPVSDHDDIG